MPKCAHRLPQLGNILLGRELRPVRQVLLGHISLRVSIHFHFSRSGRIGAPMPPILIDDTDAQVGPSASPRRSRREGPQPALIIGERRREGGRAGLSTWRRSGLAALRAPARGGGTRRAFPTPCPFAILPQPESPSDSPALSCGDPPPMAWRRDGWCLCARPKGDAG